MTPRTGQKGEGRIGLAIAIVIVGTAVFMGLKIIPVRVVAYEFRDVIREEARYGAVRASNAEVHTRIMDRASEMGIPLNKKNLKVSRNRSEIVISARYEQPINLKLTTYVFKFDHREKAPLF